MHQIIKSKLFFPGFYQCSMFFSCSRIQRSFPTSLVAQGKGIQVHLFQQGPEQHWMRMSLFVDSKICMVSFKMNHVQRRTHVTWTLLQILLAYLTIHSSYQYLSQSHTRCRVKCSQTIKVKTWQNTTVPSLSSAASPPKPSGILFLICATSSPTHSLADSKVERCDICRITTKGHM